MSEVLLRAFWEELHDMSLCMINQKVVQLSYILLSPVVLDIAVLSVNLVILSVAQVCQQR